MLSIGYNGLFAQSNVQPSIMVVPNKKGAESYRTIIENNQYIRSAISIVNQAFLERDFRTIDFITNFQTLREDQIIENTNQKSIEQTIAENTNADIIVKVDAMMKRNSLGNYVEIILSAIDRQTSQNLSTLPCTSGEWNSTDFNILANNALQKKDNSCLDNFLEMMQGQFTDIRKNGRPIKISITYNAASDYNGDSDVGDDFDVLSDLIQDFLLANAFNQYARCPIKNATKYECDDFRIPLKNPKNPELPYDANDILRAFRKHFGKNYGINCRGSVNGSSLNITICGSEKCN